MRLIDADAFEAELNERLLPCLIERYGRDEALRGLHFSFRDCISNIQTQPTIEPERKKGKWNTYYHGVNENPSFTYSCNQCGYSAPYGLYGGKYSQKEWAYCPNCGADMRGGKDEQA